MKKKYITFLLVFLTQLCAFAQEWTGIFSTKFGDLKLVTENGIIYGDYANGGTILAVEKKFNGGSRLCGLFHNGADRGKFYFAKTTGSKDIRGHYNYDNNITLNDIENDALFTMKFDFDAKWLWDGTKVNNTSPADIKTAVFNGLWNTTDGNLILQQVGNKVTGTYKNVGTVDGIYTPQTRKLKGTFYNNTTKKTGHFEFDFEGNTFKGKWGWTAAMTDGSWNGTKNIKNNKEVPKPTTSNVLTTNSTNAKAFDVNFQFNYLVENSYYFFSKDIYGIGWCKFVIKHKETKNEIMINPLSTNYLDKYGRIYEIPRKNTIALDAGEVVSLMNNAIRFKINPKDYGYNSVEEMAGEAYFDVTFEIKIKGITSDNIIGKERVRIFIENADIKVPTEQQLDQVNVIKPTNEPGYINIKKGDYNFGVYYSFKKLN